MQTDRASTRRFHFDGWKVSSFLILCLFVLFVIYPMTNLFIEAFTDSATG